MCVRAPAAEDMWHAFNLVRAGDRVTATTFRKVSTWVILWHELLLTARFMLMKAQPSLVELWFERQLIVKKEENGAYTEKLKLQRCTDMVLSLLLQLTQPQRIRLPGLCIKAMVIAKAMQISATWMKQQIY